MQYTAHYAAFSSDNKQAWADLSQQSLEAYPYHLAFELSQIAGFKTGFISVYGAEKLQLIAPIFVTDYALDTTVQGALKAITTGIRSMFPRLLNLRILCVGSAVTDSAQIFFAGAPNQTVLQCLNDKLIEVAATENASVIAFKDVIETDFQQLQTPLESLGYSAVDNMPVAANAIDFNDLDDYLASLSYSTRKGLRRKMKNLQQLRIEEHDGLPPKLDEIAQLYLNCFEKSELKFEKLNRDFFENIAKLMPNNCRFVLYFAMVNNSEKLIGFNCLLHGNGVLMDKYIGLDYIVSQQVNLYSLSWLHNIQMCIRDGFHTFQSGQAAYETKLSLGATLTQTYILFKHRNPFINPILKLVSRVLAYGNFDPALKDK
jgi:hypothetical protein